MSSVTAESARSLRTARSHRSSARARDRVRGCPRKRWDRRLGL